MAGARSGKRAELAHAAAAEGSIDSVDAPDDAPGAGADVRRRGRDWRARPAVAGRIADRLVAFLRRSTPLSDRRPDVPVRAYAPLGEGGARDPHGDAEASIPDAADRLLRVVSRSHVEADPAGR